jgi:hypothetical protein
MKPSSLSMTRILALLLVMLITFPVVTSFGADGLPPLNAYLPDGANPPLRCVRSDGESVFTWISFPVDTRGDIYVLRGVQGSDAERLICAIANDPSNSSLIDQGSWVLSAPDYPLPYEISTLLSGPRAELFLVVGQKTSDYTLFGPISGNYDLACCTAPPVPAFNHWGLLLFAVLLLAAAFWFLRRQRVS